jgi:hypothetical protein
MKLPLLLVTLTVLLFNSFNSNSQSPAYAVFPQNPIIAVYDTATMAQTATFPLTSSTGTVTGANGLVADLCGTVYIIYKVGNPRYLGTIDPTTGVITEIGLLSTNLSNIAFVNGILWGVSGDGSTPSETLFSVNTSTAALTPITALGNGNDGESIAFNPDDGLLYHWSGWVTPIMESIDPANTSAAPVNIPLSGGFLANVGASTYAGNGQFLISDVNTAGLKYVSSTGVVSLTANTTDEIKGLSFPLGVGVGADVTVTPSNSICLGDTSFLVCNNVGVTYEWFLDGISTANTTNLLNTTVSGTYVCEIDNGVCVVSSDTISVTVSNIPTANITPTPSASICAGDSIELMVNSGGGPAVIQWYVDGNIIGGATSVSYFASASGSYNVTKTNLNGCTDSSAVATLVTLNPLPIVSILPSPTVSICAGDSIELAASGGAGTFQWSLNSVPISGATGSTYYASADGSYNLTKTNINGCADSSSIETVVTVNPVPPVSLTPGPTVNFCSGDTVEITIAQGGGGGTYQWYMNGATIPSATTNMYFASAEGSYNLVKTNMNGCSDSAAVATTLIDTCSNKLFELIGLSFDIYPNPASDYIQLDLNSFTASDLLDIRLVGIDGKVVRVINIKEANQIAINTSNIKSGVYFVQINTVFGRIVKEIVIK